MIKQEIIGRGAEAILLKKGNSLLKKRIKKSYRHPTIDKTLRKRRTKSESKILNKLAGTISVPKVKKTEAETIEMEFLSGKLLSSYLDKAPSKQQQEIAKKIGKAIARIHSQDIIHGDLTTSNMILKGKEVYFIDFGLAFHSAKAEDKAVDIHLLRQALDSKHFKTASLLFKEFAKSYTKHYKKIKKGKTETGRDILERLKIVEKRGRYKRKGML